MTLKYHSEKKKNESFIQAANRWILKALYYAKEAIPKISILHTIIGSGIIPATDL